MRYDNRHFATEIEQMADAGRQTQLSGTIDPALLTILINDGYKVESDGIYYRVRSPRDPWWVM